MVYMNLKKRWMIKMSWLNSNKAFGAIKGIASDYINSYTDIASNIAYSAVREFG